MSMFQLGQISFVLIVVLAGWRWLPQPRQSVQRVKMLNRPAVGHDINGSERGRGR
jgi:hypothetical protein